MGRITRTDFSPRMLYLTDGVSKTIDSRLTTGGIFSINDERLRLDGPRPNKVGLYLRAQDGTETKVEALLHSSTKASY